MTTPEEPRETKPQLAVSASLGGIEPQSDSGPRLAPTADSVPTHGELLGLDYGTRRIGVAISNPEQTMALPLQTYDRRTDKLDREWLAALARGYRAAGLIVGLPVHMSGDEGQKAKEARAFGNWAAEVTKLPVVYWDERYSSAMADAYLTQTSYSAKNKKSRRDRIAAKLVLQSFLNSEDRTAKPGALQ